jgi:hypothetical protein
MIPQGSRLPRIARAHKEIAGNLIQVAGEGKKQKVKGKNGGQTTLLPFALMW